MEGRSDMEPSYSLGRLARGAGSGWQKGCELRGLKSVTPVDVTDLVRSGVYEKEAIIVSSDNFTVWGTIVGHVGHVLLREDMELIYPIPLASVTAFLSPSTSHRPRPSL